MPSCFSIDGDHAARMDITTEGAIGDGGVESFHRTLAPEGGATTSSNIVGEGAATEDHQAKLDEDATSLP